MTERNKWIGGVFSGMIVAQLVIGTYSTVSAAMSPSGFFASFLFAGIGLTSITSTTAAGGKPGIVQVLCLRTVESRAADLLEHGRCLRCVLTVSPPNLSQVLLHTPYATIDSLAFLVVFFAAKKPKFRYPGIPSILDAILRDATAYFIIIFSCQIISDMFVIFAPVRGFWRWRVYERSFMPCSPNAYVYIQQSFSYSPSV